MNIKNKIYKYRKIIINVTKFYIYIINMFYEHVIKTCSFKHVDYFFPIDQK